MIGRYLTYFAVIETTAFFVGFGFDIRWVVGVFFICLVLFPVFIGAVVYRTARKSDEEFESPLLWVVLAIISLIAATFMIGVAAYAFSQGSAEDSLQLASCCIIAVLFSAFMLKSAGRRKVRWRRLSEARRMRCPVCGTRVNDSTCICCRCGAIVFWVPSWFANERVRGRVHPPLIQ